MAQRVIRGTQQRKKIGIVKTQHEANIHKMRCQGCKVGYMVKIETMGGSVYRCGRCGREATITDF
jgi:predicted SprT family Zn-dependent metalloprotease